MGGKGAGKQSSQQWAQGEILQEMEYRKSNLAGVMYVNNRCKVGKRLESRSGLRSLDIIPEHLGNH